MTRNTMTLPTLLGLAALATACGNPAVDPGQVFPIQGAVLDATGQPIQGATVQVIKYWSDSRLLAPSIEHLFSSDPTASLIDTLNIAEVTTTMTGMDGSFKVEVTGEEVAQPGGYTTAEGLVEVASVLVLVKDPNDASGRAGVVTYAKEFMRSDTGGWLIGDMKIWDSVANADVSAATTSGLVSLRWQKIERGSSTVKNTYRIWVGGTNGPSLLILCSQGDQVEGGCGEDPSDPTQLVRHISAFSLRTYYANADGSFEAFVMARGVNFRYASRFAVQNIPDLTDSRDPVSVEGIWAVGVGADQELTGTAAVDGNPATRVDITNNATAIYAKLPLASVITDAGVLNTLVRDAAKACLVLEFSPTVYTDVGGAKAGGDWVQAGKFCGENGAANEVSALAGFDTSNSEGKQAGWMRLRAELVEGAIGSPEFEAVGEIAIYKKQAGM